MLAALPAPKPAKPDHPTRGCPGFPLWKCIPALSFGPEAPGARSIRKPPHPIHSPSNRQKNGNRRPAALRRRHLSTAPVPTVQKSPASCKIARVRGVRPQPLPLQYVETSPPARHTEAFRFLRKNCSSRQRRPADEICVRKRDSQKSSSSRRGEAFAGAGNTIFLVPSRKI